MSKIIRKRLYEISEQVTSGSGSGNGVVTFFADSATTGALPSVTYSSNVLTATANGVLPAQDGVTLTVGQILLVKDQISTLQNGLYEVTDLGSVGTPFILTRTSDYNETAEIYPSQVNILGGTTQGGNYYLETFVSPTVGTDPITYITIPTPISNNYTPLTFVDTVADTALPNTPVYADGAIPATPGYLATYTSATNTIFPTLNGLVPFVGMKVLVSGQVDQTKNGNYELVTLGSGATKWQLRRIFYTGSQLYPVLTEVLAGNLKGAIYQQNNKSLINATIGSVGNITYTNINPGILTISGIWGIASSSGVYTYYSTYTLAVTAAVAGQTIELFGDITQSTGENTLKTGVHINGNGHTITFTTSNSFTGFLDGGIAYIGNIQNINIIKDATVAAHPVISLTSSSSIVDFTGTTVTTSGANTYGITSFGKISNLNVSAGHIGINLDGGTAINCNSYGTLAGIYASNSLLIGCYVNDNGNALNSLIKLLGGCTVNSCRIISTATAAVGFDSTGVNYFNNCIGSLQASNGISSSVFQGSGSDFYTSCSAVSPNCVGFNTCGTLSFCSAYSSAYIAMYNCTNNYNCTYIGGRSVFQAVSTTVAFILNNCVIKNITNASGANAIYLQVDGCIITNCDISVANTSAYCITGDASHSVQYANNTFKGATTPLNNVTQAINAGNTSDTRGNININT